MNESFLNQDPYIRGLSFAVLLLSILVLIFFGYWYDNEKKIKEEKKQKAIQRAIEVNVDYIKATTRRNGKSTRLIDEAIQTLFNEGQVCFGFSMLFDGHISGRNFRDEFRGWQNQKRLFIIMFNRIKFEHCGNNKEEMEQKFKVDWNNLNIEWLQFHTTKEYRKNLEDAKHPK